MTYTPFHADWKDYPDLTTPITAAALEHIEAGVDSASPWVNVMDYGAAADGVTNDHQAFVDAVAAGSGGRVIFPSGNYVNNSIVSVPADTEIVGCPGTTITGYGFKPHSGCAIRGFSFVGDLTNAVQAVAPDETTSTTDVSIYDNTFTDYAHAIYIDRCADGTTSERIRVYDNYFSGCVSAVFAIRANGCLIHGNTFKTAQNSGQAILFWGGSQNVVTGNHLRYGTTGILFLFHRSYNNYNGLMNGNIVANNIVRDMSEEGISFDLNGNTAADIAVFDHDTVASKSSSGGYKITLTSGGWSGASNEYINYYACFNSGNLAGQVAKITAQSSGTLTLDITAGQFADITAGDTVVIGSPSMMNTISGNHVDSALRGTTDSITLYGFAYLNTIAGNTVVGADISVRGLNSLAKSTLNFTNVAGMGPCEGNIVVANTLVDANVALDYLDFGASSSFTQHGNYAAFNQFSNGAVTLSQQDVPAYTVTNASTDRALNVSGDTTAQVAAVLGTLIADLQSSGVIG